MTGVVSLRAAADALTDSVADEECHIMLIERQTTLHTGTQTTDRTRSIAEQLRPL